MLSNRSIQPATVIPNLAYPDVNHAADWLCAAFGFSVRLRIGTHRVQLNVGDGAVTLGNCGKTKRVERWALGAPSPVRVDGRDAHCRRAKDQGAPIAQDPVTQHVWRADSTGRATSPDTRGHFAQSVADVDPREWRRQSGRAVTAMQVGYRATVGSRGRPEA